MRTHSPMSKIQLARDHTPPAVAVTRLSPSKRGYGTEWKKLRLMVLARSPLCVRCQSPGKDVDHIMPKAKGGADTMANLQVLCHACHSKKTAREDQLSGRRRKIFRDHGGEKKG